MVGLSLIANTLGIVNSVAGLITNPKASKGLSAANKAYGAAKKMNEVGGPITQLSRQTTIFSRVFLDENVIDEIVLPHLMKSMHEWYAAQILSALSLSAFVDDKRTVQDMMSVVQTGDNEHRESVLGNIIKRSMGIESFVDNLKSTAALEALGPNRFRPGQALPSQSKTAPEKSPLSKMEQENKDIKIERENTGLKHPNSSMQLRSISASENRIGPMGELFEVTITNPKTGQDSQKVPVFIQMQPSVMPAHIAPRFIDMNVAPSTWQRWTQWRTGEITFWRDFIAARDLIHRQRSLIKDPEVAAAFSEFLKSIHKKDSYALADVTDRTCATHSQNLANSVVVFSEETVAQAKADSAIDLHNAKERERYFRDTYTMMIVVIDAIHQRVTIYFNGIDGELDCGYSDFRPKDSKFDPKDFMNAMTAFSTNSIGRMR